MPTRPTLISVNQTDKPIRLRELGQRHNGLIWTIRPGNPDALQRTIDMVNEFGGPDFWEVVEIN